jgi:hypothetical protein
MYLFILTSSLHTKPSYCVNCKHFIPSEQSVQDSKCSFFQTDNVNELVSGEKDIKNYYYSIAKKYENLCGKEGKEYKKIQRKKSKRKSIKSKL